jgi:Fe-S-cluster containining protein
LDRLARHFGVSDLAGLRKLGVVKHVCLEERENLECVFLEGNRCAVHHIKPDQCRASPPGGRLCREARKKHGLP